MGRKEDAGSTEMTGRNRRVHERLAVGGGNAEFESVHGRGRKPQERGRVMNWSRGGLLLKVASPRRRFIVQKLDPVLYENDTVTCTLRFPPSYTDVVVSAEVVHAERDPKEPDHLLVGLRFDEERTAPEKLTALARMFEPKARTVSGRLKRVSGRSRRISAQLAESESASTSRRSSKSGRSRKSGRVRRSRRAPAVDVE